MTRFSCILTALFVLAPLFGIPSSAADAQEQNTIPFQKHKMLVPKDYDVVVLGGSLRAVTAAVTAAQSGASVLMIAPRPYFGEDLVDPLRLDEVREIPDWDPITKNFYEKVDEIIPARMRKYQRTAGKPTTSLTPNYVKVSFDELLRKHKIDSITSSYPSGIDDGLTPGLMGLRPRRFIVNYVNRSGWNSVLADAVIDCRETSADAVKRLGLVFKPGTYRFSRRVISGQRPPSFPDADLVEYSNEHWANIAGWDAKAPEGFPSTIKGTLYRCSADFELKEDSPFALASVERTLRDKTFTPLQVDASAVMEHETPLRTPRDPNRVADQIKTGYFPCIRAVEREILTPDELASAYPHRLNAAAYRFGKQAAELAKTVDPRHTGALQPDSADNALFRQNRIPVLATTDVLVIGGGTTGAPAAIAAARAGANTILCEYHYHLGGTQTVGTLGSYYQGNRVGFTQEMDGTLARMGSILNQTKPEYYRTEIEKAGGRILYGVMGVSALLGEPDPDTQKTPVLGATVILPDGTCAAILAHTVIDATGNADIAASTKTPTIFGEGRETICLQGASLNWRDLGTSISNHEVAYVDDTDAVSIHNAMLMTRREYGVYRWDFAPFLASRERRRIDGDYTIRLWDVVRGKQYADTITICKAAQDSHGPFVHPMHYLTTTSDVKRQFLTPIPFRALLPRGLENILVTGLGISAERDAMAITRMQPDLQNQGYAAGFAAANAAKHKIPVSGINIRELQKHLIAKNILPESVLTDVDTPPKSEAELRALLPKILADPNREGIAEFFAARDAGKHIVRDAFTNFDQLPENQQISLAMIAAVLYALPDGAPVLMRALERPADVEVPRPKDKKDEPPVFVKKTWDTGMPVALCYGERFSEKDRMILALACAKYKPFAPLLVKMLRELDEPVFSHLRAVAVYLDQIPDPSAAPELARILKQMKRSAIPSDPEKHPRFKEAPFRDPVTELMLARTLYRLGDSDGIAQSVLSSYLNDPRTVYAKFAAQVLRNE